MNCIEFESNIDALLANKLDGKIKSEMIRHKSHCLTCTRSFAKHEQYLQLIGAWQEPTLTESKKAQLLSVIDKQANLGYAAKLGKAKRSGFYGFAGGFAAASLMAVSLFIGTQFQKDQKQVDIYSLIERDSRLNQEITLVLDVANDIPEAELILNLPAELSVIGQEYLSTVSVPVSLKKGKNKIVIPVQLEEFAMYADNVVVDASLIYKNSKKDFALDLDQHLDLESPQDKSDELIHQSLDANSNKTV